MKNLSRVLSALQSALPKVPLQSLIVFPRGTALAVFAEGSIAFESHGQVDRLYESMNYQLQPLENVGGDGI